MKAVLVIDMLEDFFAVDPLKSSRGPLTKHINMLTDRARRAGCPVIWVRQEFRDDLADAFPVMKRKKIRITIAGTPGARILAELIRADGDHEIVKKRYSPFYGTGLDRLLQDIGVTELVLSGVNTHACVRMAAIDAYQRDLDVLIPRDCVASADPEHHEVTLRYVDGHIARVTDLDAVLRELPAKPHAADRRHRA